MNLPQLSPNLDYTLLLLCTGSVLLIAALAAWVNELRLSPERALERYLASRRRGGKREPRQHVVGSWQHKTQLAFERLRLGVHGWETLALAVVFAALFVASVWVMRRLLQLPAGIALSGGVIVGTFGVHGMLTSAWDRMCREIDKDIPTLMLRLSGMIQAAPNVLDSLDEAAHSLDHNRPLRPWLLRWVTEIQEHGIAAFDAMQAEAGRISSSLLLVTVEIRRLWESGGSGYVESFRLVADHLSDLMNTRAMAYAKSGRSGNLARIIIFSAIVSLSFIMNNPTSRALFLSNPLTRIGLVFFFLWAGIGWLYVRSILRSVTT